jgi:TPP-dependent indolepyruvate ferredoxin oxidoreductase alpha subunit
VNETFKRTLMMGNETIIHGLIESGCAVAISYPGTPASEILSAVARFQKGSDTLGGHPKVSVLTALGSRKQAG